MPDSFAIDFECQVADAGALWAAAAAAETAIIEADFSSRGQKARRWSLRLFDRRSWERRTVEDARQVWGDIEPVEFKVGWEYNGAYLQWWQDSVAWDDGRIFFRGRAFAGDDRIRTERIVNDVARRMAVAGWSVNVGETVLSSRDDGATPAAAASAPRSPLATKAPAQATRGAKFKASLSEHTGRYVVGVLIGLTVLVLGGIFGLGR